MTDPDAGRARARVAEAVRAATHAGLPRKEIWEIVRASLPSRASRPSRDELARMLDTAGGVVALARELGVSHATIGNWCRALDLHRPRKAAAVRPVNGRAPRPRPDHGTLARYRGGCRCGECRAANTARHAKEVAARASRRVEIDGRMVAAHLPAEAHGTHSAYSWWSCRCVSCAEANWRRMQSRAGG